MARDNTSDLVKAALAKPGCALCRLERDHLQRYLNGFMYEDVTNVDMRAKMRAAQGFCRQHAAQAVRVRDSLGLAIIYQDILATVSKNLRLGAAAPALPRVGLLRRLPSLGERLARLVAPGRSCPACAVCEEMTAAALGALLKSVAGAELGNDYEGSDGLCLPHLRRALAQASDGMVVAALVNRQIAAITSLDRELAEFIRKHDHRFRREQMGDEKDSWQRAIDMAVGQPADET
jgi:hypothetical protein